MLRIQEKHFLRWCSHLWRFHLWRTLYWLWFVLAAPLWLIQALQIRRRAQRFPAAPGPTQADCDAQGEWQDAATASAEWAVYGLGDSIIAGVGVEHSQQSLSAAFAQALARHHRCAVRWQAWGQSGVNTREARLQLWPQMQEAVNTLECRQAAPARQLVLISLGANDISGLRSSRSWRRDVRALVQDIHQQLPHAWVLVLPPPPFSAFPLLPYALRCLMACRGHAFAALAGCVLAHEPRTLVLEHAQTVQHEDFAADGYHPNAVAVARWASALSDKLAPLFSSRC